MIKGFPVEKSICYRNIVNNRSQGKIRFIVATYDLSGDKHKQLYTIMIRSRSQSTAQTAYCFA